MMFLFYRMRIEISLGCLYENAVTDRNYNVLPLQTKNQILLAWYQ